MEAQSSGDKVSQVESDIEQTLTLADAIVQLAKIPITLAWQNVEKRRGIKRSVGNWKTEAFDNEKECRMPVLRYKAGERNAKAFVEYLVENDGILQPVQDPPAKSCWAYLMHALGIKPGMDLVDWMPLLDGFVSTQNGGIEMEIDGAAFCTIINLFYIDGVWDKSREQFKDPEEVNFVKLGCGDLAWAEKDNVIHAHFAPGTNKEINMKKHPFSTVGQRMEPGTLMVSYFNVLEYGVSDVALALPGHKASLKERLQKFDKAYWAIKARPGPLLVTNWWLHIAGRAVKKAMANGGKDRSFFEDLCNAFEPSLTAKQKRRDEWRSDIRADFLFDDELPRFFVPSNLVTPPQPRSGPLKKLYERVLEGYKDEPDGSFKHDLFLVKEEVSALAGWGGLVWLPPFWERSQISFADPGDLQGNQPILPLDEESSVWNRRLLPFHERSSLWNRKVLLGALADGATMFGSKASA